MAWSRRISSATILKSQFTWLVCDTISAAAVGQDRQLELSLRDPLGQGCGHRVRQFRLAGIRGHGFAGGYGHHTKG